MLKSKPNNQPRYLQEVSAPSLVRNVCSLGTCDFDNPFPNDAYFSEVIDRDKYNLIRFHVTTAPIRDKEKISASLTIFDSNNNIVFNDVEEFDWKPSFNIFSRSWVIRDKEGSFVKSDTYRAEFRVENSSVYEYYFKITSENDSQLKRPETKTINQSEVASENQNMLSGLFKTPPKGLLLHLLTSLFGMFALGMSSSRNLGQAAALLFAIPAIIFYVKLVKFTRKHVIKNLLVALLLCSVLYLYYGGYLLISAVAYVFRGGRKAHK
jgi:hypothetical protein